MSDDSINAIVVGDGPQRAEFESLSRQLGLRDRVEFHGASCRVPDLLARSRVFALPSRYEGMPNALLEAMVSGLPVIAAAVGGVSEIVTDGETGLIIPPEDPKALAKAKRPAHNRRIAIAERENSQDTKAGNRPGCAGTGRQRAALAAPQPPPAPPAAC